MHVYEPYLRCGAACNWISELVGFTSCPSSACINLLKPTGYVCTKFNIQQPYALPTLYVCVLYLCENKQRPVPLTL
jgi:hypothetical protein